ncbi:ATP-dependent helicase [soil metagenome]
MVERMFDAGAPPFSDLNDAQMAAVRHAGCPLLVVAGAGTGKTKTLACRVAHLISGGVPPERILLLTFTCRAAAEMLRRVARHTSEAAGGRVWGGTFHAVANRLLRIYGEALRLPPQFTVMDQADAADLFGLVRADLDLGKGPRRFPKKETLAAVYSRVANSQTMLGDVLTSSYPWCADETEGIRRVFESYTARKREHGMLDFDDLLLFLKALVSTPKLGPVVGGLFDHVLVDEYQDTNVVQSDILRALRQDNANITAVGDDAQSIYSFRAATVRNILDFAAHFPGAAVIKLEQNYRSSQPILDVTNGVIAESRERHPKDLFTTRPGGEQPLLLTCLDEAQQSDAVCSAVLEHRERGVTLTKQAVLFRAAHHSAHLEIELSRRNIPFVKFGGLRFIEAAHVKDALALLRVLENPRDELAWFRVLGLVDGIGPATANRLMDELGVRGEGQVGRSPLCTLPDVSTRLSAAARESLETLRATLDDCATRELSPGEELDRLRRFLDPAVTRNYENAPARINDLEQLQRIALGYPTRARFLVDLTLDPPATSGELAGPPLLDDDYLVLSTIHSAKGCEWDAVHVIHAADGMIPSDMATGSREEVEEERRLFYVALTRARDHLTVYFPLRYYHRRSAIVNGGMGLNDGHGYAQLTRFLPSHVQHLCTRRALEPDEQEDGLITAPPAAAAVDDLLAGLWAG